MTSRAGRRSLKRELLAGSTAWVPSVDTMAKVSSTSIFTTVNSRDDHQDTSVIRTFRMSARSNVRVRKYRTRPTDPVSTRFRGERLEAQGGSAIRRRAGSRHTPRAPRAGSADRARTNRRSPPRSLRGFHRRTRSLGSTGRTGHATDLPARERSVSGPHPDRPGERARSRGEHRAGAASRSARVRSRPGRSGARFPTPPEGEKHREPGRGASGRHPRRSFR